MSKKYLATLIFPINIWLSMLNLKRLRTNISKKFLRIEKRFRFAISALVLSALLLFSTFFFFDKAMIFIPLLIISSYFFTYFSIVEGIDKIEWLTLFLIPVSLTIGFYLFFFLFPSRWLTRLPFIAIYAISIYAVLLCSNIFNVGVEKNLQLYRAAFSVNFFYQTFISFLFFSLLFITRQSFLVNGFFAGILGFIFSLHLFWSIKLDIYITKENVLFSFFIGLVLAELSMILSFVPVMNSILALFLTASYYSLTGLVYNYLDQRLFKETVREYLIVFGFVSLITLLSISW